MLQVRPDFAELSRLFERQLVAERGLEVVIKLSENTSQLTGPDREALLTIRHLFNELLEGEQILTGHNVTATMIDASIALQEVISLTREQRPVAEFVEQLKIMTETLDALLENRLPPKSDIKRLKTFLVSLAETVGQELDRSTMGRTVAPH
jgi:hypothetical protein